jgi:hypothetical protein
MSLCKTQSLVRLHGGNPGILTRFCVADELSNVVRKKYGYIDYEYGINSASTDFVSRNISQSLCTDMNTGEYFVSYVLLVESGRDLKSYYPNK